MGNDRRALVRPDRRDALHHIRNLSRRFNHYLPGFFRAEIFKLCQHLLRRVKIQGRLIVRIIKALSRHDDPSVYLVPRIQEMHVAGCRHRLIKFLPKAYNLAVYLTQVFFAFYFRNLLALDHETVIPDGLNLQVIIKLYDLRNSFI